MYIFSFECFNCWIRTCISWLFERANWQTIRHQDCSHCNCTNERTKICQNKYVLYLFIHRNFVVDNCTFNSHIVIKPSYLATMIFPAKHFSCHKITKSNTFGNTLIYLFIYFIIINEIKLILNVKPVNFIVVVSIHLLLHLRSTSCYISLSNFDITKTLKMKHKFW